MTKKAKLFENRNGKQFLEFFRKIIEKGGK
jgi:hypothetical protein